MCHLLLNKSSRVGFQYLNTKLYVVLLCDMFYLFFSVVLWFNLRIRGFSQGRVKPGETWISRYKSLINHSHSDSTRRVAFLAWSFMQKIQHHHNRLWKLDTCGSSRLWILTWMVLASTCVCVCMCAWNVQTDVRLLFDLVALIAISKFRGTGNMFVHSHEAKAFLRMSGRINRLYQLHFLRRWG
jgi:hypothetical protein